MSTDLLIGIDAGTSVIRAVAFDMTRRQVAQASRRNSYRTLPGGGAEQEMERTWTDTAAVLRALGDEVPGLAGRTIGLGVTGQGDGTWLIDADGAQVQPAGLDANPYAGPGGARGDGVSLQGLAPSPPDRHPRDRPGRSGGRATSLPGSTPRRSGPT